MKYFKFRSWRVVEVDVPELYVSLDVVRLKTVLRKAVDARYLLRHKVQNTWTGVESGIQRVPSHFVRAIICSCSLEL